MSVKQSKIFNNKFSNGIKTSWGSGIVSRTTSLWRDVNPSEQTIANREKFRRLVDEFATFAWRGVDAFNTFGAFIINEKNNLQFYNGASFSNEYSSPQYSTSGKDLLGISFNVQKIAFKVGVYWISIHDYRRFINWLDPYEIDYLSFGYNQDYSYLVKLAEIKDSPRMVVGREGSDFMYYTELTLTFEIQGEPCVRANVPYEPRVTYTRVLGGTQLYKIDFPSSSPVNVTSDLDVPFSIVLPFDLSSTNAKYAAEIFLEMRACVYNSTDYLTLGNIQLQNLNQRTLVAQDEEFYTRPDSSFDSNDSLRLNLKYDSEAGLMFVQFGNGTYKLLTLQTTAGAGDRMVHSLDVNKFKIPGLFSTSGFNLSNFYVELRILLKDNNGTVIALDNGQNTTASGHITLITDDIDLIAYARTNIA